jgi:hypothetical protein
MGYLPADGNEHANDSFVGTTYDKVKLVGQIV